MNLGHLNIPKPKMENVSFVHDIQTQLYLQYSRLIEIGTPGSSVLKALEEDPRVRSLEGSMISKGSSASRFEIRTLAMWFLWAANEFGYEVAESNLNTFLNSETVPVINTLWILGIELDGTIELGSGVRIIPIEGMPDSRDKEQYLKHDFGSIHQTPKPRVAITCINNITKSIRDGTPPNTQNRIDKFWKSKQLLQEVSLILNAIDGVSCIPYFSTSYSLPEMPIGIFGGTGGGAPLHDIYGFRSTKLTASSASEINDLLASFRALPDDKIIKMSRALSRLSQAKRREQIEDKILDLGIALEMALLDDNKNNNQLSLSFRLRGSWLIAKDHAERKLIYRQLKDIYNYRSQVAHGGALCGNDPKEINAVREKFQDYSRLAERIIRQLIRDCNPDWSVLILGGI